MECMRCLLVQVQRPGKNKGLQPLLLVKCVSEDWNVLELEETSTDKLNSSGWLINLRC